MKKQKLQKLLFILLLCMGMNQEVIAQFGKNNLWFFRTGVTESNKVNETVLKKTATAPVIDGNVEAMWDDVPWNPAQYYRTDQVSTEPGMDDGYFEWKGLWDEDTYYLLIHVVDDVTKFYPEAVTLDFSGRWWTMDAIELYGNPSPDNFPPLRDEAPNHWVKLFPDLSGALTVFPHAPQTYNATAAVSAEVDENGLTHYYYEYKDAPWEEQLSGFTPVIGEKMRLAIQVQDNDDDESAAEGIRDNIISWADSTDASDGSSLYWGTAIFGDESPLVGQVDFVGAFKFRPGITDVNYKRDPVAPKAVSAPTIDGDGSDEAWSQTPWHPYQTFAKGSDPNASDIAPTFDDCYVEWKAVWDDETVYFLIHVADDVVSYKPETDKWWWQDAIEFYVRGDGEVLPSYNRNDAGQSVWHRLHPNADALSTPMNNETYESEVAMTMEVDENGVNHIYYEYKDIAWADMLQGNGTQPVIGDSIHFSIMVNDDDDLEEEDTERDHILMYANTQESRFGMNTWPVLKLGDAAGNTGEGQGEEPVGVYTGQAYAGEILGRAWEMPGNVIDNSTTTFIDSRTLDIVDMKLFDVVDNTPDIAQDTGVVFGIYTDGTPGDGGGQDIRGYNTNGDPAYAPIRYNGGSQSWRQSGKWTRYTVNLPAGTYHFVYRGDTRGFTVAKHKFDLNIYKPGTLESPELSYTIDMTGGLPAAEGDFVNNLYNLGGGNANTDWLRLIVPIEIKEEGDYIVELDEKYFPYGSAIWGEFTFNDASEYPTIDAPYAGRPFTNGVADSLLRMPGPELHDSIAPYPGGTVDVRWFDVVADTADIKQDTAVVFGIYPPDPGQTPTDKGGQDVHNYNTNGDSLFQPLRFNGGPMVWRGSGKWTRYTLDFPAGTFRFAYRADSRNFSLVSHKFKLKIYDPSNMVIPIYETVVDMIGGLPDEGATVDGVENIGGGNANSTWLRRMEEITIPSGGSYVVEIDEAFFPYGKSIMGEFSFDLVELSTSTEKVAIVKNLMKVFPNPTTAEVRVQTLDTGLNGRIDLYSLDGRLLQSRRQLNNVQQVSFDMSQLEAGMYIIRLIGPDGMQSQMVVKQ